MEQQGNGCEEDTHTHTPELAAASMASMATIVFPDPTSPCSNLSMRRGRASFVDPVASNQRS
eukprot:1158765-Pelagomonas_calceolata.AAC.2